MKKILIKKPLTKKVKNKKTDKTYFQFFFLCTKITINYYHKYKEKLQKELHKSYQNLSEKKKTKSFNMLVSDIEILLKKKKKKSVNMVVNNMKIF